MLALVLQLALTKFTIILIYCYNKKLVIMCQCKFTDRVKLTRDAEQLSP